MHKTLLHLFTLFGGSDLGTTLLEQWKKCFQLCKCDRTQQICDCCIIKFKIDLLRESILEFGCLSVLTPLLSIKEQELAKVVRTLQSMWIPTCCVHTMSAVDQTCSLQHLFLSNSVTIVPLAQLTYPHVYILPFFFCWYAYVVYGCA